MRWYLAYPLSSRQVLELLAERGIDVSHRTVLNWRPGSGSWKATKRCGTCGAMADPVRVTWYVAQRATRVSG